MVQARVETNEYTRLSEREVAGSGIGTSPSAIAGYMDLQRAVFEDQPNDTADVREAADQAQQSAAGAQDTADDALFDAATALAAADDAQERADDAYDLAATKVTKNLGPPWAAPTATPSRAAVTSYTGTASATYTQVEVQALMDRVTLLTNLVAGLVVDGRANESLTK